MTNESIAGVLPDYEIGGELGRGGFGVVLRGRHRNLRRDVAIKELPPALATVPDVRRRFAAEARVLASLSHPHIVPIYDYVERDGHCLLVMELLPGGTVWSQFKDRGFTPESACAVVMATCAGLHYAHERGVLHRDVKPENLLFSTEGVLKISDFGIAKVIGGSETLATKRGEILGTPAYMAPEQAGGPELTPTADVYATGVMLFELLSGQLPYSDEGGALAILYRHVYEDPLDIEDVAPSVPVALADATMRAIAQSTRERFQTAEAFGVALGEAAATAWGPDWLSRADLSIVDPGPIGEAAKRPSHEVTPTSGGAGLRGPNAAAGRPSSTPSPAPSGRTTRIRPAATDHGSAAPANLAPEDLVPVREVIDVPSPPLVPAIAALVLLILTVAAAFIGLGAPAPSVSAPVGVVIVAGTDVAGGAIDVDLAKPVEVAVGVLPPEAAEADAVQLAFSVGKLPLPPSGVGFLPAGDGLRRTTVEATSARFLAGGEMTGEVQLLAGDEVVLRSEFLAQPAGSPFLTVPGVVTVLALLALIAYAESLLRRLRRGRHEVSGIGGLAAMGGGIGAALVPLGWMLGAPEPRLRTFVVCVLLGVGAGIAAAMAGRQVALRSRLKPNAAAAKRRATV